MQAEPSVQRLQEVWTMLNTDNFVVIDTETTWENKLMSIGAAVADSRTFQLIDQRYYILLPYKGYGGMYSNALYINGICPDRECSRPEVIAELRTFLAAHSVRQIFAYNALFDYGQLPELKDFQWYDIMKIAAYRQHNRNIPNSADCFKTGRLKRGYGVESIYRLLSGDHSYSETHNALFDATDELAIMQMLGHTVRDYEMARIYPNLLHHRNRIRLRL